LLADALGWSSEKWSKASGRATVGLDQVRTRLSMSIPTYLDYIRCYAQSHWKIPAFGYINNQDHRLIKPCGRSPDPDGNGIPLETGTCSAGHKPYPWPTRVVPRAGSACLCIAEPLIWPPFGGMSVGIAEKSNSSVSKLDSREIGGRRHTEQFR
jgi:hypothetical protein